MVTKFITAKESDKVMHKVMLLRIKIDNKLIFQKKKIFRIYVGRLNINSVLYDALKNTLLQIRQFFLVIRL